MKTTKMILSAAVIGCVGAFADPGEALAQRAPTGQGADLVDTTRTEEEMTIDEIMDTLDLYEILYGPGLTDDYLRLKHDIKVCEYGPCAHTDDGTEGESGANGGKPTGGKPGKSPKNPKDPMDAGKGGNKGTDKADRGNRVPRRIGMAVPGHPVGEGYASRQLTTPRQPVTPHQLPSKAPPRATATNPRLPQPATVRPKPVVRTVVTAPGGVEVTRPTAPPAARSAAPVPVTPNIPAVVRPPAQAAPNILSTPRVQVRVRPNVEVTRPAVPVVVRPTVPARVTPRLAPTPRVPVQVAPRIPPTPRLQVQVRPNVAVRPAVPVAPPVIAPTPRLAVKVVAPRG